MTKKRIKQFRDLDKFVWATTRHLRLALRESLDEIERLKHRCKRRCKCGARCFRVKGHTNEHGFKRHKSIPSFIEFVHTQTQGAKT